MKISVVLLDWSIRESFHSIYYLNKQSAVRSDYELIWVEYFERKVPVLMEYLGRSCLDSYLILGKKVKEYNKHEAWNTGVLESSGDIVVLCDSDVMFKPSFIQSIIDFFQLHENSFLLIDEIRSENKSFWPFSYPTWEKIMSAPGIVNWNEQYQVTSGLSPEYNDLPLWEKMFYRNYGACLCVRKADYIRYGGLDEHDSYVGYICGPYDLAVRMINAGMQEHWHTGEFLLHTYHPWINPGIDRIGPNFWHNSTTSFKHLLDGNIMPYVENKLIRTLRKKLFPEPPREGTPKFSVIVPEARPHVVQRLSDSIKNSTKFPFEVIFIGKEASQADEPYVTHLTFDGSFYSSLLLGCRQAKGEIIVIVPYEAMFRHNALDRLLDFRTRLLYPTIHLNAIETFTQGFIWQHGSGKFAYDHDIGLLTAFERNLVSKELTDLELRKIFCEGKKLGSILETPVHLEIWHGNKCNYDNKLELLVVKMLDLGNTLLTGKEDLPKIHEAEDLLEQICAEENNSPGTFLKYFFLKRYSLREYYNLIVDFQRFNRIDLTVKGLKLLVTRSSILTKNINENIKEVAWFHKLIYSDIAFYIASAHYVLAAHKLDKGDLQKAISNLELCLDFAPGHSEAKQLLKKITS